MAVAIVPEHRRFTLVIEQHRLDELREYADLNHRSVGAEIRLAIDERLKDYRALDEREAA